MNITNRGFHIYYFDDDLNIQTLTDIDPKAFGPKLADAIIPKLTEAVMSKFGLGGR